MISRINAIVDPLTGKIIVQTPLPPINCLSLEGGGSRCLAYVGAYKVLYKNGMMDEVVHIAGSSGGSICALAIALGYDPDEAETALLDLDLERFLEDSQSALSASSMYAKGKTLLSVLMSETFSLSSGNEFLEWLRIKVEKKMGNKHATFEDLAKRIEAQGSAGKNKYLYITGTNISLEIPESKIFSHENTPKMELALAAYISSCLPGVFPPVEYDGCLWFDGGIMNNLPTKIFDADRFLPKGYGFTHNGVNPGVLALKVDTKNEINQILYGIIKKVDLSSASEVVTALYNALSQNTDTNEIRTRMTLALSDNKIGVLQFTVNRLGKIGLISSAEEEAQDFIENYYNSAYEVKTYKNIAAWLSELNTDEIDDVMVIYEQMREKLKKHKSDTIINTSDDVISDANSISEKRLDEYIDLLEAYIQYRRKVKRDPELKFYISTQMCHINIPPALKMNSWSENIKNIMNEKLKHVNNQIMYLNARIESMRVEFNDLPNAHRFTLLHHKYYFENIQVLTSLLETMRILQEEKKDLRVKLGIYGKRKRIHSMENSKRYADFIQILQPLLQASSVPEELACLLPESLPIFKYKSASDVDHILFMLDLRNTTDRILYITAALMYLAIVHSKNKDIFINLYRAFICPKMPLPRNMKELSVIFGMDGAKLLVMAYRMEELMHLFERRANPKLNPTIKLDIVFGLKSLYEHHNNPENIVVNYNEVQMKHFIHSNSIFSNDFLRLKCVADNSKHAVDEELQIKSVICDTDTSDSENESDDESDDYERSQKPSWF